MVPLPESNHNLTKQMTHLDEGYRIGDYTVDRLIKEGRFHCTYRVVDGDGNPFFLKLFDEEAAPEKCKADGEMLEAVLGRRIRHANVTSYVTEGNATIDGKSCRFLVTSFFRGVPLSQLLDGGRVFSCEEAKSLMKGVLDGLLYLHSIDLNHNGLSPGSIMVEEAGGRFVSGIVDLGHLCPTVCGTPPFPVGDLELPYCAPEALAGLYDEDGDTFSAAAILYTLLSGHAPWPCDADGLDYLLWKKAVRAARRDPLDVDALSAKGVPDEVIDTIGKGLELDCAKRISLSGFRLQLYCQGSACGRGTDAARAGAGTDRPKEKRASETSVDVEIKKREGGGFSDVAGMEKLKAEMTNRVIWVLREKEKAERYRLRPPNGMVLYGPPGCGKTFFAEKFAEESQFNFVLVNGSDLGSVYLHGTQGKIANLFKEAEKNAPSIICFDEFDSFVPSRSSTAAEHRSEEVNEFLGQLNNCSKKGIFVIGTTNRLDLIDPAVLRKGRMDLHVEIPAPDEDSRRQIFAQCLKGRPLADDVDCAELARLTDHYACADLAFIVEDAAMTAALADEPISQGHLLRSVGANKSSLDAGTRKRIGF